MTPYERNLRELESLGLSERNIVVNFPPLLARLYRAVGMRNTIVFLAKFGGLQIYLPENPTENTVLGHELGSDLAHQIVAALGEPSSHISVPCFPSDKLMQRLRFVRMLECDVSLNSAVRAVGVSRRTGIDWKARYFHG